MGLCGGSKRGLKSGAASGFDYYDAEQEAGADAGAQRARAAGSAHSNAAAAGTCPGEPSLTLASSVAHIASHIAADRAPQAKHIAA